MKKISIIIPIFNGEKYLEKCIVSILNQTYKNFELILVDDGSTDSSYEICNNYYQLDNRIQLYTQNNMGVSAARNKGIRSSIGDLILFIDCDDWINNDALEIIVQNTNKYDAQMYLYSYYFIDEKKKYIFNSNNLIINNNEALEELLKFKFSTSLWMCVYKREAIFGIFLNEKIHYWEDYEYQFRVLLKINKIYIFDGGYYHHRNNEESITHQNINEKKISCLVIPDQIKYMLKCNYPKLTEYIFFIQAKFLISILGGYIYSIHEEKYCRLIKQNVRKSILNILRDKKICFKTKFYLSISAINPNLFCVLYKVFKGI